MKNIKASFFRLLVILGIVHFGINNIATVNAIDVTSDTNALEIRFYQPDWNESYLHYNANNNPEHNNHIQMKNEGKGWWRATVVGPEISFSFSTDEKGIEQGIDLGGTRGNYPGDPAEPFRTSHSPIWVKDGLIHSNNPDLATKDADELVILTINLHTYQELKQNGDTPEQRIKRNQPILATVAQAIKDLDADLVCLQEVGEWRGDVTDPDAAPFGAGQSNAARKINSLLGGRYNIHMDWSHYGWEEWREGVAILSKTPFSATESRFVTKSKTHQFWKSRNIVRAETEVKGIGKIDIFSVHTGWWNDDKEPFQEQFRNIINWADEVKAREKPDAIILCGDLNIEAGSAAYHFATNGFGFRDLYYHANSAGLRDATIDSGEAGQRIDYILMNVDSNLDVTLAQRIFTEKVYGRVSDHNGIYVRISPRK